MVKKIPLSAKERRILITYLGSTPCSSGCAWVEMDKPSKSCDDCELNTGVTALIEKLEGMVKP